jgi:hypothetical protein
LFNKINRFLLGYIGEAGQMRIIAGGSEERKPIQVRSEALRHWDVAAPAHALGGFPLTTDNATPPAPSPSVDGEGTCAEAGIKRAIHAAEQAGLKAYRIEIGKDGTLSIVVGEDGPDTPIVQAGPTPV